MKLLRLLITLSYFELKKMNCFRIAKVVRMM